MSEKNTSASEETAAMLCEAIESIGEGMLSIDPSFFLDQPSEPTRPPPGNKLKFQRMMEGINKKTSLDSVSQAKVDSLKKSLTDDGWTPSLALLASPPLFRWPAYPSPFSACPRTSAPRRRGVPQMAKATFNPSDDRFTNGIIQRKLKQLIGRAGFTEQDRDDLRQELFMRLLQSLPLFKPDVAHRNRFITAVVERHVATILRNRRAAKRDDRRVTSLNISIEVNGEGPTELSETISDRELDSRLGRNRRSDEELADLALDLAAAIEGLPESRRTLLELRKTKSMSEAARELGIPRTTLNEWMRRIRKHFEKTGLTDYFES